MLLDLEGEDKLMHCILLHFPIHESLHRPHSFLRSAGPIATLYLFDSKWPLPELPPSREYFRNLGLQPKK